jgi:beta-glucosidase/6-phospho-beta-glucosidase/beta-galactosidase
MIRVISFRKAALAGLAGALVWEVVLRAIALAGLPLFDIVRGLGTLVFPDGPMLGWWAAGMAAHAVVGAIWAIFYAYFFWSWFDWPPVLQGLVFALLPALLALFLVYPQLQLMHLPDTIVEFDPFGFLAGIGWREPTGLVLGHLIFGSVMGALYTHPVGYPADRQPLLPRSRSGRRSAAAMAADGSSSRGFIFATGIECSYPTIEGGRWRRDQMAATHHYRRWREDFSLARQIGVSHLRYGPPLHLILANRARYDWEFVDEVMAELRDQGPEPIVDLCHFGLPTWLGGFDNPEVSQVLAGYAQAFAGRFPWVRFYTPVNEMYVCARLSALIGIWNEQRQDDASFVAAVCNLARAGVLMSDAILAVRSDAIFVNSESSEFNQPCCPDPEIMRVADLENERRFLPLDLLYAHPVSSMMRDYLREHGMPDDDYDWFMRRQVPRRTVLGIDYYEWNEKLIDSDGQPRALGELFGWYVIASQYYERYRLPMMHTETNRLDARDAPRWLWRQWHNVQLLRGAGVPLVGFTWYSLTDQVDWDIALSRPLGNVNPVGLFDLNRDLRPVGLAYRHLIESHRGQPGFVECPALTDLLD